MKKILIFGLLFVAAMSCSKKSDPAPADQIAGNYTMTQVVSGGLTFDLPINSGGSQISGTMTVVKKTETSINLAFKITTVANGKSDVQTDDFDLNIKANGSNIDIYDPANAATKIGTYTGGTITLEADGTKIVGKKS